MLQKICPVSYAAWQTLTAHLFWKGIRWPIAFLRYNPHAYKIDGTTRRCTKTMREARLLQVLRDWTFGKSFDVAYMYYDSNEGSPVIFADPLYDSTFKMVSRSLQ